MERVCFIPGKNPLLFVAPHGADDINTAMIAEFAAKWSKGNALINKGFERSDVLDVEKDQANCNRIDHVKQPVIYEEFLQPILKLENKLQSKSFNKDPWDTRTFLYIFYIHGCGDKVHQISGENISVIVGYGLGNSKDSLSCKENTKNVFINNWRATDSSGEVYEAQGGGKYAGRDSNNMNQYFRKHEINPQVESLQLEFPFSVRKKEGDALSTALILSNVASYLLKNKIEKLNYQKFI